jgi:uncharacterized protein (DUF1330 family)
LSDEPAVAGSGPLVLAVPLWTRDRRHDDLAAYEDEVLALLDEHDGEVLQRLRAVDPGDHPTEMQVIRFPSKDHLDRYMVDDRRLALAARRGDVIERTEVIEAMLVV